MVGSSLTPVPVYLPLTLNPFLYAPCVKLFHNIIKYICLGPDETIRDIDI